MFKINVLASQNLVESKLSGLLSVEEVAAYHDAIQRLFSTGSLTPGYRMLIDVGECVIQPQDVIDALIKHVAATPKAHLLATVTRGSVIRMQVRRVMRQPYMKMFDDRAAAMRWLTEARLPPEDTRPTAQPVSSPPVA